MAGNVPDFSPDGFRTAIRFAMDMGAPTDDALKATFYFKADTATATGPLDASGVPYGPDAVVTRRPRRKVQVTCGLEYSSGPASQRTSVGGFGGDRVVVTLLDEDYELVRGFEFVVIGGVKYRYVKDLIPRGLGTVTIHQVECAAEDAT